MSLKPLLCVTLVFFCCIGQFRAAENQTTPPQSLQGTVTWIYDGDTLQVDPIGKVRLIGIDCPEHQEVPERDRKFLRLGIGDPAQLRRIAHEALQFNIRWAKGQTVTLTLDETSHDRYGRMLAYVYLPNGRLLNQALLENGLAIVYQRFSFRLKESFRTAEAAARDQRVGLWETTFDHN